MPRTAASRSSSKRDAPVYEVAGGGAAARHAAALLESLDHRVIMMPGARERHPALEWAASGAMELTGPGDGAPLVAPGNLAAVASGALQAIRLLAGEGWQGDVHGPELLGERAAIMGLRRRGRISPGGSCRLLMAEDGWIAVSLARPDDIRMLPAWLGEEGGDDPWALVTAAVAHRPAAEIVARGRLIGLAVTGAEVPSSPAPPWYRVAARGPGVVGERRAAPLVVDLSSLWAGPLAANLLGLCGAHVIKVESTGRPDGARAGAPSFYDLLNGGKRSVALDFRNQDDLAVLGKLFERADIVVESARPRALAQLGIDASSVVERNRGLTWVGITGYGRGGPSGNWIAYGDDAAVAAGLTAATGGAEQAPLFCGDAIADPLTGLHAAVAALSSWKTGGGRLLDVALRDVAAHGLAAEPAATPATVRTAGSGAADMEWEVLADGEKQAVLPPRARPITEAARPLGADTEAVRHEIAGATIHGG